MPLSGGTRLGPYEVAVPFIEMLEYSGPAFPPESFRYAIGDAAPEVAKLMPELRRMYPDIPPSVELPPEQQRRFLFNSYREFVDRAAFCGGGLAWLSRNEGGCPAAGRRIRCSERPSMWL